VNNFSHVLKLFVAAGEVRRVRTERYFDLSSQVQRQVETSTERIKLSQMQDAGMAIASLLLLLLITIIGYF